MKSPNLLFINALFHISILTSFVCSSQTPARKLKEFKTPEVKYATVDRLGNYFFVLKNGCVNKYDATSKRVAQLKGRQIDLLEPWFHPSIFIFDRANKKTIRYGRHFDNPVEIEIDASWAIEPYLATVRANNHIWILDKADFSLKHINPISGAMVSEFSIDTAQFARKPNFTQLREYQNLVFVLDENSGILIFSIIGNQIAHIKKAGIRNFNFVGEELYYPSGNTIIFFDLSTEATREVKVEGNNLFSLVTDERIILIDDKNKVRVWETPLAQVD